MEIGENLDLLLQIQIFCHLTLAMAKWQLHKNWHDASLVQVGGSRVPSLNQVSPPLCHAQQIGNILIFWKKYIFWSMVRYVLSLIYRVGLVCNNFKITYHNGHQSWSAQA